MGKCTCDAPGTPKKKGMCLCCYQRDRLRRMPPATCHPDRRAHAGGLCRQCYAQAGHSPRATCHPTLRAIARGLCRKCYSELPDVKARAAMVRRLKKYKLREDDYVRMLTGQGGACPICAAKSELVVDHDHSDGSIRGLLCRNCNAALGLFGDNPAVLRMAADYLEGSRG